MERDVPASDRRVAYPPPGMGEPFWVDDPDFDVSRHVLGLGMPNVELDERRFAFLCDGMLSAPLPRDRPLWEVRLASRLTGRAEGDGPGQRPRRGRDRRAR
jgi:diacylglycerol O-acyltransferase / wax synthase